MNRPIDRRSLSLLTASHLFADLNQGALPAMLPYFIAERHFSYQVAAGLVLATNLASSLLQPLFGHWADRHPRPWLAPAGLLLAGLGVSLAGVAPHYWLILVAVAGSGIGLAAFHPEAARLVHQVSSRRRGAGMGMFTVGGNAGFAIGPLLTTSLLAWGGLSGSLALSLPAMLMASLLLSQLARFAAPPAHSAGNTHAAAPARDAWAPFLLLMATVICRSVVFFGLNTFLPLYWIGHLHASKERGSAALTLLLLSGACGTLLGGRLADHLPRRTIVVTGLCLVPPLLFAVLQAPTPALALVLLIPLGFVLFAPFSVMVVMGQEYLPNRVGVASGVTLGLAGTIGGLATPLLGRLADHEGIRAALVAVMVMSAASAALALTLRPVKTAAHPEIVTETA